MKILVFDNYDSFTYNLVQIVRELGYNDIEVVRNNRIELDEVDKYDKIILSPGPGTPSGAGILVPLIKHYAYSKSIFGVCLGMQAIGVAFGASLINLTGVYHGVSTPITVTGLTPIFDGLPATLDAGRYHSWIVVRGTLPASLRITAEDDAGNIMALSHQTCDVHGVQFHPESVLTPLGYRMIENFLKN